MGSETPSLARPRERRGGDQHAPALRSLRRQRRFAGTPTYVQRAELAAALAPDYLEDWVRFEGATYVELDGDVELFDGVSVLSTPGHSVGHQSVIVDTPGGVVVLGGDVTHSMRELIDGATPSILRIHELKPSRVYLAHDENPWVPVYS